MQNSVALTVGEPAGVGPELALAAWPLVKDRQPYFLIGDRRALKRKTGDPEIVEISSPREACHAMATGLPLLHLPFPFPVRPGQPDDRNAESIIRAIGMAAEMALKREAISVCTNPVGKVAFQCAEGGRFSGHTDFLAHLCGAPRAVMMLATPCLKAIPVTVHVPLSEVPGLLTEELIGDTIEVCHDALANDFGVAAPRIAVSGLNPHAGEGGMLGTEDGAVIAPAIRRANAKGILVSGPFAADTLFREGARESYDAAICMYHDQALIPAKTLDFHRCVNITLGLPIVRTSPAHGTATDIAGRGLARPDSLAEALIRAGELGRARASAA